MGHIPSLPTLRAFEAAARHRSFSRAGDELGLTHGAISHRIRALEEHVGERLFARRGNMMEPTRAAGQYLASVRQALGLLAAAFGTAPGATNRTLRVAVLPSFASHWLVPRLQQFRAEYPGIAVSLDASLEIVPLGRGCADVAIRQGHGDWPGVHAERLTNEIVFPVCAPAYRDGLEITTPDDLRRCELLRYSWMPWSPWFTAAALGMPEPTAGAPFTDAGLLIDAAVAGHGIALARSVLVADALASGRLVRLFDISVPFEGAYWLVRPQAEGRTAEDAAVFGKWLSLTLAREFPLIGGDDVLAQRHSG